MEHVVVLVGGLSSAQAAIDENPNNVGADAPMVAHVVSEIAHEGPADSRTEHESKRELISGKLFPSENLKIIQFLGSITL